MNDLAERLRSWAQNEEMIDQHFTEHGTDCNRAASVLDAALLQREHHDQACQCVVCLALEDFNCASPLKVALCSKEGEEKDAEIARLQAVVDAARAWDAESFNPMGWHQVDKDLHDALRALDGEP